MTTTNLPTMSPRLAYQSTGVNTHDIFAFGVRRARRNGHRYVPIQMALLVKKVGTTASRVWGVLVGLRNVRGIAHPTRNGISRILGISVAAIAKALRKLKSLGLVQPLGRILCTDKNPYSTRSHVWAHAWRVIGVVGGRQSQVIRLPRTCKLSIDAANTWGGKRRGSGRPKKSRVSAYNKNISLLSHPLRGSTMAGVKDAPHINLLEDRMAQSKIGGVGRYTPGWWTWLERNGVPAFPGRSTVPPPVVPHPPKLTGADVDSDIRVLGEVYRAAVKRRYKKKSWALVRGELKNSKHYDTLTETVSVLLEYDISPVAWVDWHMTRWQEWNGAGSIPPLSATYDPTKVRKWRGWFAKTSDVCGGRALITDSHRNLLGKYRSMRREIRKVGSSASLEQILNIVARHFPDGLYDLLIQKAKAESQSMQFKMEDSVRKGRWIW